MAAIRVVRRPAVVGTGSAVCAAVVSAGALMIVSPPIASATADTGGARAGEPGVARPPTRALAWTASVVSQTRIYDRPGGLARGAALATTAPWNAGPVGLLVLERRVVRQSEWLRVLTGRRPSGHSGWISGRAVEVRPTAWRVEVSLAERRVRLLQAGRVVLRADAVIGAAGTPTPVGRFAVAEAVPQPDPRGFLGPWALHLTALSGVLDDFGGGPGRIGLHGRDGPSLLDPLGSAASHGCVRLPNGAIRRIARVARPGTPVAVIAGRF